jgi:hypothetical protein
MNKLLPKEFKTREETRAFLKRCGLLKTTRILEGEERQQIKTMLRLLGPGEESNNQRFWTEEWVVGDKTYQHTTGSGMDELSETTEDDI